MLNHLARAKNFIGGAKAITNLERYYYSWVSCQLVDQEAHAKICMATPGSTLLYPLPQLILLDNDLRVQCSDAWFILNPVQHSFPPPPSPTHIALIFLFLHSLAKIDFSMILVYFIHHKVVFFFIPLCLLATVSRLFKLRVT